MLSVSADDVSVDTQDAANVVARIDYIIASLEKAGVPTDELQHFKKVVNLIRSTDSGTVVADDAAIEKTGVIVEGPLEKLQQGVHGFAPVWKLRWIRVLVGEMQVFESKDRPTSGMDCLFSLPLSVQQTRIEPGNEALCKKFGKEAILMVSSTAVVGGSMRCVTLATTDYLALERWMAFLEKAISPEGFLAGASVFRASQTGDILRVKELIGGGVSVNRSNAYGCVPLHYAVKNAAECAAVVARGGEETTVDGAQMRAQEALRVVVFLMSHGGDARAVNNVGETPMDIGARLTRGFPKARKILVSILDSSKYEISGGTIFIVPGKPQLQSVEEEDAIDEPPDPRQVVRASGVRFAPSRRNQRARKEAELADSRRPHTTANSGRSTGLDGGVRALSPGDHETVVGGATHRLAADFSSSRSISREASRSATDVQKSPQPSSRHLQKKHTGREQAARGRNIGVMFKDMRMAKNSAVLVSGYKRRRGRTQGDPRPSTCFPLDRSSRRTHSEIVRPTTTGQGIRSRGEVQPDSHQYRRQHKTISAKIGRGNWVEGSSVARRRLHEATTKLGRQMARPRTVDPGVSDFEARRQISEWLRSNAGAVVVVPPAAGGRALGGHLIETSGFVANDQRTEVYKALRAIKGDNRGELISADKLRSALCRTGQPLQPSEMNELLKEADPGNTGYVSCSKLSKLITTNRLAPLAKGTYNEEDDVVLQAKARRLARLNRLKVAERAAAAIAAAAS